MTAFSNSQAIISPDGSLLGRYRKTHLFTPDPIHEERIFEPGAALTLLAIQKLTWGFSICYDLRFPELYRLLAPSRGRGPRQLHGLAADQGKNTGTF